MKFFGTPNMVVNDSKKDNRPIFRFNEKGEYETENEMLIKRLKQVFKYEDNADSDLIKCKKCGKTFENKGLFLAHCRSEHKGGD